MSYSREVPPGQTILGLFSYVGRTFFLSECIVPRYRYLWCRLGFCLVFAPQSHRLLIGGYVLLQHFHISKLLLKLELRGVVYLVRKLAVGMTRFFGTDASGGQLTELLES